MRVSLLNKRDLKLKKAAKTRLPVLSIMLVYRLFGIYRKLWMHLRIEFAYRSIGFRLMTTVEALIRPFTPIYLKPLRRARLDPMQLLPFKRRYSMSGAQFPAKRCGISLFLRGEEQRTPYGRRSFGFSIRSLQVRLLAASVELVAKAIRR